MFVLPRWRRLSWAFAVQRGATCSWQQLKKLSTGAASDDLLAMLEAAVWVAVGLGVWKHLSLLGTLPPGS